ncbi:MAG: beta-lactamase family protein [Defluviitaleaceae bacterium]|nr:beta-lactamase family protein [Defluviitaleaceae bacterium]
MKAKKFIISLIICTVLITVSAVTAHALPSEQADAIQQLIDDAVRISGTPGISVAVISDNQTHYFNSGHTSRRNRNNDTLVGEHTLYEIGSLSKSFTALGILLLEEQGLLSTANYIEEYLTWFYLTYQNEAVPVTIQQLLNHTSGLSDSHQGAPQGEGADMLRQTTELFLGARLDFAPGSYFAYGNANYIILGLIIEAVSGQSYEAFMIEQVFQPLGLYQTFLYHSEAIATGRMASGHRHAFFTTFDFDAPIYGGMKPTGFIISGTYDMARWMGIHLGLVQDIPEIFFSVIDRVRQVDTQGPTMGEENVFYSNGWWIELADESNVSEMGHAGQTPNFLSNIILFTSQERGVVFLSNGTNVDFRIARRVNDILSGDLHQSYTWSARQLMDMINSIQVILFSIFAIWLLISGILSRLKHKPVLTKSKLIMTSIWVLTTVFMTVRLLLYPTTTVGGAEWSYIIIWNPPALTISMFIVPIFFAIVAWRTYTKNPKPIIVKENVEEN